MYDDTVTDNVLVYGSYATGFKGSGFSPDCFGATACFLPVDKETVDTIEFGVKSRIWEDRLQLNATYFNNQYDLFKNRANLLQKSLDRNPIKNSHSHHVQYRLNYMQGGYETGFVNRSNTTYFQKMSDNLDQYYISEKLRHTCTLLGHTIVMNTKYDFGFLDELLNYLKNENLDAAYLYFQKLKRSISTIKWIADFRDPWSNIDFAHQLNMSNYADRKNRRLEAEVLKEADKVVVVSWTMAKEFQEISAREIDVVTNGYNHTDFTKKQKVKIEEQKQFELVYLGSMNGDRNPSTLWRAFANLKISHPKIYSGTSIRLIGKIDHSVIGEIDKLSIEDRVIVQDFVPHDQAIDIMQQAPVLFLIVNKSGNATGILTGKVFEYLGATRPIICIGPPTGDMKKLLSEFDHTYYIDYDDDQRMQEVLVELSNNYISDGLQVVSKEHQKYSRENLTDQYFNNIILPLC